MEYNIKNPKGFEFNRVSFNEFWASQQSEADFIKWGKEAYVGHPIIGNKNESQTDEMFKMIHQKAIELAAPKEKAPEPLKGKTPLKKGEGSDAE